MAGDFGGLTAFDENGVVEADGDAGEQEGGDAAAPAARATPAAPAQAGRTENTREWPTDGTRPRGADGKFQGDKATPEPKEKPAEPAAKVTPPPAAPERRKFRVPKEDGSGHDEVELTDDEVAQRVADARKLVGETERARQAHAKEMQGLQAVRGFMDALKSGKNQEQALLGAMRASGMSEEQCEDALVAGLHGYVVDAELTPEQRRLKELEGFKAQQEEQQRETEANAEHQRFVTQTTALAEKYAETWSKAMELTGWPATPELLADIGREHMLNKKRGYNLTAAELASYVTSKHDKSLGLRLKDLPATELAKRFPDAAKAWTARTDEMAPADFLKDHPAMGKKLLAHFREVAKSKNRAPAVGATRPAPRAAPGARPSEDAPQFYDPWASGTRR